jgi:hypothetical protein
MGQTKPDLKKYPIKKYPTIGVCGLDCGLCPRYYTIGPSRCPECAGPDFFNKHPSCSFITCCVKKKNLEVCAECSEFPCSKFKGNEEYQQLKESSSYPSYKKVMPNLNFIKEHGNRFPRLYRRGTFKTQALLVLFLPLLVIGRIFGLLLRLFLP